MPFVEALLLPWGVDGGPVGTLWIVAHSDRRKFDREDVRLMGCMTPFGAGAIRLQETLLETQRSLASARVVSDMAHHINNPLQGAMLALYNAQSAGEMSADVRKMLLIAENELQRATSLSAALLQKTAWTPE